MDMLKFRRQSRPPIVPSRTPQWLIILALERFSARSNLAVQHNIEVFPLATAFGQRLTKPRNFLMSFHERVVFSHITRIDSFG